MAQPSNNDGDTHNEGNEGNELNMVNGINELNELNMFNQSNEPNEPQTVNSTNEVEEPAFPPPDEFPRLTQAQKIPKRVRKPRSTAEKAANGLPPKVFGIFHL